MNTNGNPWRKGDRVVEVNLGGVALPREIEAEKAVLSTCANDEGAFGEAQGLLTEASFASPSNAKIWRAFVMLAAAGKGLDIVTIAGELRTANHLLDLGGTGARGEQLNGAAYLLHVLECAPGGTAHVVEWCEAIRLSALRQKIVDAAALVRGEAHASSITTPATFAHWSLEQLAQASEDVAARTSMASSIEIVDALDVELAEQWAGKREAWGLPLPWPELHRMLHGWEVGVHLIAALEGGGKSVLAQNAAEYIAEPDRVFQHERCGAAILSLEMPRKNVASRGICRLAKCEWSELKTGRVAHDSPYGTEKRGDRLNPFRVAAIDAARTTWKSLHLEVDDGSKDIAGVRLAARQAQARLRRRGARLRMLVVDHVHLLKIRTQRGTYSEGLGEACNGLNELAKEMDIAILALAQFTQEAARREGPPVSGDVRDAAAIKQIAANIVLIDRPWAKRTDKRSAGAQAIKRDATIYSTKVRNGGQGDVPMKFIGEHFKFEEADEDAPPADPQDHEPPKAYAPNSKQKPRNTKEQRA